jgi:hypothetical protein
VSQLLRIEGYADQLSARPGESIGLCISTNAPRFDVEIARLGAKDEVVFQKEGLSGVDRPVPDDASTHGCRWPASTRVPIATDWRSGCYGVRFRARRGEETAEGQASFVVQSARPGRDTKILIQLTTNTYNAYNSWGGANLYRGPDGPARRVSFDRPDARLPGVLGPKFFSLPGEFANELDREKLSPTFFDAFFSGVEEFRVPGVALSDDSKIEVESAGVAWRIIDLIGAGPALYQLRRVGSDINVHSGASAFENPWKNWEHPFIAWAEEAGYVLDYAVNGDLESRPDLLEDYRLVLSVGHDEYWSWPMRDNLEAFIAGGGNVAFFSGNSVWWQVRCEDDGRALVAWKEACREDPVFRQKDHSRLTTLWCSPLIGRPENRLTGVSFAYGGYSRFFDQFQDTDGAYTIHRPDHWIFEGTGLRLGDRLGAADKIIGYECDGCELEERDGLPVPTHKDGTPESFEVLATAPAGLTDADGSIDLVSEVLYGKNSGRRHPYPGAAVLGAYTRGGTVVTSGCTEWARGLRGRDPAVERITRNVLDRLST